MATGAGAVTARGVCWSTGQNPTITDNKTTDGTGSGAFSSSITRVNAETTYYVRAYATNSIGTSYGTQVSFSTKLPVISTTVLSSITATNANSGGNLTDIGGAAVTDRGVCWSTSSNPTISDNKTTNGTGSGIFTSYISGLTFGTTYFLRAYATNSIGTAYGSEISFRTNSNPISIGSDYAGGIIFYIDNTGNHGLVCNPTYRITSYNVCYTKLLRTAGGSGWIWILIFIIAMILIFMI